MKAFFKSFTLKLLWKAVDIKRRIERPSVIAITGTIGKTSTKEAVSLVLEASGRPIVKTYGNLNTETGVALSLLGFKESPRGTRDWIKVIIRCFFPPVKPSRKTPIYVLEFSADQPGDIAFLSKKFSLDAAIMTQITPVHMGKYADFNQLIEEKFSIVSGLRPQGTLILNSDDPVQVEQAKKLKNIQVLWYGLTNGATKRPGIWGYDLEYKEGGMGATVSIVTPKKMDAIASNGQATLTLNTQLLGPHQFYSLLAAVGASLVYKVPTEKLPTLLEKYMLPPGRGRFIEGIKDMLIVDDSYNASPDAVKLGLSMLRPIAGKRRIVAILGNMNELGDMTAQAHADVGAYAAGKVDFLVAVGPNGEKMATAAKEAGQAPHTVMSFSTPEAIIDKIDQLVKRRDLVYIRGSQNGVFLERLVKRLMAKPSMAPELLVRQSRYWYDKYSR